MKKGPLVDLMMNPSNVFALAQILYLVYGVEDVLSNPVGLVGNNILAS